MSELIALISAGGHPDKVAIVAEQSDEPTPHRIGYSRLLQNVHELEQILKTFGVRRYSFVAAVLPSSLSLVMVLLSILQMGAVYIPMASGRRSASHTLKLIRDMPQLRYLVCEESYAENLANALGKTVVHSLGDLLLGCRLIIRQDVIEDHERAYEKYDLAYIINTSGTTRKGAGGVPVRVSLLCIAGNVRAIRDRLSILPAAAPVIILASAPTFDPSLIEILLPLTTGGTLIVPCQTTLLDPERFHAYIRTHFVTHLFMTPSLFMRFDHEQRRQILGGESSVRHIVLGGEPFPVALIRERTSSDVTLWNIYGTTECSVWATLQKVIEEPVGIGEALNDTEISLQNISDNQGELWIGGPQRICLVGDEKECQRLRPTGDLVRLNEKTGFIHFIGRKDNQVKLSGYRVNLEVIATTIESLPDVSRCEIIKATNGQADYISPDTVAQHSLVAFVVPRWPELNHTTLLAEIRNKLDADLPFYSRPDDIRVIPEMPVTQHGKADRSHLLQLAREPLQHNRSTMPIPSEKQIMEHVLDTMINRLPARPQRSDAYWWFLAEGGTSIDAARTVEDIVIWLTYFRKVTAQQREQIKQGLLCHILHSTMNDLVNFVIQQLHEKSKARAMSPRSETQDIPASYKRPRLEAENHLIVMHRAMDATAQDTPAVVNETEEKRHTDAVIRLQWKVDLKKCVDASAVISVRKKSDGSEDITAYIGSHAGIFAAIDVQSGMPLWQTQLGGRIESSGCLSPDGSMVIVGCYDHRVYAISTTTGDILATFETGAEVKCSPRVDAISGHVWFGSHDAHLYCVHLFNDGTGTRAERVWSQNVGASVFATCAVDTPRRRLFACTLGGKVSCISVTKNDLPSVSWNAVTPSGKPIFSSPAIHQATGNIIVGCVDEYIYTFDGTTGEPLWSYRTKGPVFSSPCISERLNLVFVGSHDCSIICIDAITGEANWPSPLQTPAAVCASPSLTAGKLVVASITGWVGLIDVKNVRIIASTTIAKDKGVFSSPVCYKNWIVVGGRDDYVYGFVVQ